MSFILIVDDQEPKRYALAHTLRKCGFTVEEATTGTEALATAELAPSLVVLDVNLPDMSGFAVCRKLRANPRTASIPILHVSATYTGTEARVQGLDAGADGYLTEPIEDLELVATIRALLRIREAEAEAKRSEESLKRELAKSRRLEDELRQSYAELEHFSSIASHDLKEPLRTISLHLSLLEKEHGYRLDEEALKHIQSARTSAVHLGSLVDSLLDYSLTANRPIEPSRVDLNALVHDEVLRNLEVPIEETGARFVIGKLPVLEGDVFQLGCIFQNLISNALKFRHPDRSPEIRIGARFNDGNWTISVKDNGTGFEPRHSEKAFQVFKRLHPREVAGSGIGLAVCRRAVERHGGKIWVETAVNEGSTFEFTLPEKSPRLP